MPGRVILEFPAAKERTDAGIEIPETSQMRLEFAQIHDIGPALDAEQYEIKQVLDELKRQGIPVCMSFASGVAFWKANYDPNVWGWLKNFRSFRIEEPSAYLVEETEDVNQVPPEVDGVAV
jgi:hypothetical protein